MDPRLQPHTASDPSRPPSPPAEPRAGTESRGPAGALVCPVHASTRAKPSPGKTQKGTGGFAAEPISRHRARENSSHRPDSPGLPAAGALHTWMFSSKPPHSGPAPFRTPLAGAAGVAMSLEASRRGSSRAWEERATRVRGRERFRGGDRPDEVGGESAGTPKGKTRMFGLLRRPEVKDVAGGGAGSRDIQDCSGARALLRRRGRAASTQAWTTRLLSRRLAEDGGCSGGGGDADSRGSRGVWGSQCKGSAREKGAGRPEEGEAWCGAWPHCPFCWI